MPILPISVFVFVKILIEKCLSKLLSLLCQADMLFNSTARDLDLDTGAVSCAILNASGPGIQTEVNQKCPDGLQEGEYVTSTGGNLNVKMIFHAFLSRWDNGKGKAEQVKFQNRTSTIVSNLLKI